MNKAELVDAVATMADLRKADAARAVEAVLATITRSLKKGHEVRLPGFGTFTVDQRAARTGRNLYTGEVIEIPRSKQPRFKAGKTLRDAVK